MTRICIFIFTLVEQSVFYFLLFPHHAEPSISNYVNALLVPLFPPQCLKQYVELLIKEGLETAISCPDSACPKRGHLQENEVRGGEKKKHSLRSLSFSLAKFAFWLLTGCQSPKLSCKHV